MTTADAFSKTLQVPSAFGFPDPPEDPEDKMTSHIQQTVTGETHFLVRHLGNPETTIVAGELYISPELTADMTGLRYPDLFVAFDVDPAACYARNAYVISEQGKPPDFVLEIASRSSGREDTGPKRETYAALLVPEYWRFDETGRYHGTKLAGDRLTEAGYVGIPVAELDDGSLQGYSAALNLNLRWVPAWPARPPMTYGPARGLPRGLLKFYDPATGLPIASLDSEQARADAAEARVRELEEQLRRQQSDP